MTPTIKQLEELLHKAPRITVPKLTPGEREAFMKKMGISKEEHDKWHKEHGDRPELTPDQHEALMKRLGISKEEDEHWHKSHDVPVPKRKSANEGLRPINPFAIGGGFLAYCVKQGWLIQEGKGRKAEYFVTRKGERELKRFEIEA